ncbi:MAG: enoyl-CoA hydratase/isomerase family protein [Proteobacteria bacterium]|nr:enoyl-CoA hydratase/isomerase family protein [Pseudomonadota bacterium]
MDTFEIEVDADGIALVTFDVPGRSMNTLTAQVTRELPELVARIRDDAGIKGAVITSGKSTGFCAGADLAEMGSGLFGDTSGGEAALKGVYDRVFALNRTFRDLETCGKPVAAAINGLALGGGFELTLACHHRVLADHPKAQVGLPEVKVGLLPGGGGTQRVARLIGAQAALMAITEGKSHRPAEALSAGLVHQVVPADQVVEAARTWVREGGDAVQPWDKQGFKLPGGGPYTPQGSQVFVVGNALLRKQSYGNYPAVVNVMKAVYEGLQVPMDAAIRIESRYFVKTLMTPQARAMIRTLFLSLQELNKGSARPQGVAPSEAKKVAVLGAGMMGAGIAYVQAMAGIETVLIDTAQEGADKGKSHSDGLLKKRVSRGQMDEAGAEAVLARITPTTDYAAVGGSDMVIEAVFETREIKAEVTRKAEAVLGPDAVFGSNTSTLPITGLAEASQRPENFIGIHFFSPVDKMMLVEIIKGEKTSEETIAKAVDYVLKIKKTPIVVNDSRGFYTSRCFSTYLTEGLEMLAEGIAPAIIDNVGRMTGMPRGPLEMHDDVALDLSYKIGQQTRRDLGQAYVASPAESIVETMVTKLGRFGRKNGKGFYDYPADKGPKTLWPGLSDLVPVKVRETDPAMVQELKTRLLYRQAVEAARCMAEGVVSDPRDADVGAILGWGFAPWTGGPLSLIESVGPRSFVDECDRLAATYGERFRPPEPLREMATAGGSYYPRSDGAGSVQAA